MPIATQRIHEFLTRWETRQVRGYVPCNPRNYTGGPVEGFTPIGASGVTIATGLDLGQQGQAELKRFGLSAALRDTFAPYLGRIKRQALEALRDRPLFITDTECDAVNMAVHGDYIRRAAALYDAEAVQAFAAIPGAAQVVVVSLFYQLGGPTRWPVGVWEALQRGDWLQASRLLTADGSRYKLRRHDEGKLLENPA